MPPVARKKDLVGLVGQNIKIGRQPPTLNLNAASKLQVGERVHHSHLHQQNDLRNHFANPETYHASTPFDLRHPPPAPYPSLPPTSPRFPTINANPLFTTHHLLARSYQPHNSALTKRPRNGIFNNKSQSPESPSGDQGFAGYGAHD